MAGVKISALPAVPVAPLLTDIFPAVQAGVTYKETLNQVLTLFESNIVVTDANFSGVLALNHGGSNKAITASAGSLVWCDADSFELTAVGSAGQLAISTGITAPAWTTATFPATAGTSGNVLVSNGTNWSSSATTGITALGAQAQALNMNSHLINNVTDPVSAQDAATKAYVDSTALNGTSVYAASAGSLGIVTQSGAGVGATLTNAGVQATFALDSVNPPVGSKVLIKDTSTGATAANEGIYTVTSVGSGATNWVLTRSTSYDTPTEINNTGLIAIQNGSTLAGQAWYNTATIVTVDTTNFSYSRFGTSGTVTSVGSGTGLTGGAITSTGTLSFAAIAAHSLWANVTAGSAVPTEQLTSTFLQQVVIQVITATGASTYTPTAGMKYCTVEISGGGGAGGSSAGGGAGQGSAGAGGSGGGYCRKTYTAAQIGANAAVVIGTGGTPGAAGNHAGGNGADSTFTPAGAGAILTAAKGTGGGGSPASAATTESPDAPNGGAATNGDLNIAGGIGGEGICFATGSAVITASGGGSFFGTFPPSQTGTSTQTGLQGTNYGVGGGGAGAITSDAQGGAGKQGVCYITEYIAI